MIALQTITFYQQFESSILAGLKTITLRDDSESHFQPGQCLSVATFESNRWFCNIQIISVTPVKLTELNETHAEQENMFLEDLIDIISKIYPDTEQLFEIKFTLI